GGGRRRREEPRSQQHEDGVEVADGKLDLGDLYGAAAGWVEARTSCPHLGTMPPAGAELLMTLLACLRPTLHVMCSRFINKHMLCHHEEETGHCLALSFSDLSVWCFSCDSYLDVQAILELRPSCTFVEVWRTPFQSLE
ncbi:hypothetical protein ACJX0J_027280, partial [Zea mays]